MAARDAFAEFCAELFAPLGAERVRRMFGGHGAMQAALRSRGR